MMTAMIFDESNKGFKTLKLADLENDTINKAIDTNAYDSILLPDNKTVLIYGDSCLLESKGTVLVVDYLGKPVTVLANKLLFLSVDKGNKLTELGLDSLLAMHNVKVNVLSATPEQINEYINQTTHFQVLD